MSTGDSQDLNEKSSSTAPMTEGNICQAEEIARAVETLTKKPASPWRGWSFLYKVMFIVGVGLILVLSCLLPILVLQQVNSNGQQDTDIRALVAETAQDDNQIVANQNKILANEASIQANNAYRESIQMAICHATPGCVIPPAPAGENQ